MVYARAVRLLVVVFFRLINCRRGCLDDRLILAIGFCIFRPVKIFWKVALRRAARRIQQRLLYPPGRPLVRGE